VKDGFRSSRRHAAAAGLVAAAAVAVAAPLGGSASGGVVPESNSHCAKHYLCVWSDPAYQGQKVRLRKRGVSNKIFRVMNDQASSAKNHRSHVSFLYSDINGDGESFCLEAGQKVPDLGTFSDVASSTRLSGQDSCPA
jgi:hypothetical protein